MQIKLNLNAEDYKKYCEIEIEIIPTKGKYGKFINKINKLNNLKSDYFIQKFFEYMSKRKSLETIKYNKYIQKRVNININNYKEYSEKYSSIEIEIIPMKNKYGRFINIYDDKKYYHIYFNDNKEEIKYKYEIKEGDKVTKVKIIIDYQVKSFKKLFVIAFVLNLLILKNFTEIILLI